MNDNNANSFGTPFSWNEEYDVIIIGSGYAGITAAIAAAEKGCRTAVLEKMLYCGGNSLISGGGCAAWDSKLKLREKLDLGEDSWEAHYDDTIKSGGGFCDKKLVELMVKKAPDAINELHDAGVRFENTLPRIGGHSAHRSYQAQGYSGRLMYEALYRKAEQLGCKIKNSQTVYRIWRENDSGPVTGVCVILKGEQPQNIRAKKGVIIASGGFGRDLVMRREYCNGLDEAYNCTNHMGATGEVIRSAVSIGAAVTQMELVQLFPCASPDSGFIDRFSLDCYSGTGYGLIYVDSKGKRFVNELAGRDEVSDAQVKGGVKPTWSILNEKIYKMLSIPADVLQQGIRKKRVVCAETIAQLAEHIDVPPQALEETVRRHNAFITKGVDSDFGKPMSEHMKQLTEGPFYAIGQWPSIHYCMGGLRIDCDAQVLDTREKPIPRLFAAGEACGGIHGKNRLGGNAILECLVFGRIAGENVAKLKRK